MRPLFFSDVHSIPSARERLFLRAEALHRTALRTLANNMTVFTPGSLALPRGGTPPGFGFRDGKKRKIPDLENDSTIAERSLK